MSTDMRRDERLQGVYAILDADAYGAELSAAAEALLAGGIRLMQYRAKAGVDVATMRRLHEATRAVHAVLIVNDDYAAAEYADGLHIGQDDFDSSALARYRARRPEGILGISAYTPAHLDAAPFADYYGVGPLRMTVSKAHARPALGVAGILDITRVSTRPTCAIGGITASDFPALRASGCAMVACIGAFASASDRQATAAAYVRAWRELCPDA